ncbi:FecR family protein [Rhodopirellula sallentina]|uniref:FecR protein domain protein n=1 Tax=Rhodopirellula sallentina SM41 TaxID=1263870 RepID=M5UCU4_9BACT|nr:FecR family protein [Rhodopirellula sallentina]EMI55681.1 FecR protein domain protein [Rhodopirellula sallentina SM41]
MKIEMEKRIEEWLEGSLDAQKQDELTEWLKEHPDRMQEFVEANIREQMLRDAAQSMAAAENVRELATASKNKPQRSRVRFAACVAGIAACLLFAFIGDRYFDGQSEQLAEAKPKEIEPFSSVVLVQEGANNLQVGDRLSKETINIDDGIVRLVFDDGVEVTLQGPASYELIAPGETRLHAGVLTATVPEGAEGFQVHTRSARVVDLGTAFGIEQNVDGTSLVSVFDGEVEVIGHNETGKRLLSQGQAIELSSDGSLSETEFSSQQFEKLWPAASGIAGSTGAFEFAPQWPRMLRRIESDTKIFVLPEGYPEELIQPCPIDRSADGSNESAIPTGQRVRSFLLQFNSVDSGQRGPGNNRRNRRRIEGSITFDRPVLGLIIKTETLEATDELFSLDRARGLFGRGLELGPPPIADSVSLSEDRRTLTLDLFVVDRLSDHVRVIVDAELNAHE